MSVKSAVWWGYLLVAATAFSANPLIKEIDNLRNSLPARDPGKPTLTLRLADVLFDEVVAASKSGAPDSETNRNRSRAILLYKESLSGNGGEYAPVAGALKYKVQFQLARLFADQGLDKEASVYWKELVEQNEINEIKREAALRLAEIAEKNRTSAGWADAQKYYSLALKLCQGSDVCSYAHYRLAWLYKEKQQWDNVISEAWLSLWDSKGQIREEALRDLLTFYGESPTPALDALQKIEDLSRKMNRPRLVKDLADAYFSAGNKKGGTQILARANNLEPDFASQIRLMEEYYGLRDWDHFREMMAQAMERAKALSTTTDLGETEKVLRRLTVQLDGERITKKETEPDFKAAIQLYLTAFAKSPEHFKMMEGWLNAESNPQLKQEQLKQWLTQPQFELTREERFKLHEYRGAIAETAKDYAILGEEMAFLSALDPNSNRSREFRFKEGFAALQLNDLPKARAIFAELSKPKAGTLHDVWSLKSELLETESLAKEKKYSDLIQSGKQWLSVGMGTKTAETTKAVEELKQIVEQAKFEEAVSLGQTASALSLFKSFCETKQFLPKSCENARVLAVQLKDQETLHSILKLQGKTEELAAELELSGHFLEAAQLLEGSLGKSSQIEPCLKIALLYELGGKLADRDRLLVRVTSSLKKPGDFNGKEEILFHTLKDAELFSVNQLKLPWSDTYRVAIADELETQGRGNSETKKLLLNAPQMSGNGWKTVVTAELSRLDSLQEKIHFYGKNSKRKFEERLAAIKKLSVEADKFLKAADLKARSEIATTVSHSYQVLATEITESPMPPGLDESQIKEVKAGLFELAKPFIEKSQAYAALIPKESEKSEAIVASTKAVETKAWAGSLDEALKVLHTNPFNQQALMGIKEAYEKKGQARLASYFEGRLKQLQNEGAKP